MSGQGRRLVVVSGGGVGRDPFDPRSWSGSSRHLVTEVARRGLLRAVVPAVPSPLPYGAALARTYHRNRDWWRSRLMRDVRYRRALTAGVARPLARIGAEHPVLQLGGYYDVASVADDRDCYGYFDGTMGAWANDPGSSTEGMAREVARIEAFEAAACRGMSTVFTMSEHLRGSVVRDYGVPPDRVVVAGAGINEELPAVDPGKDYRRREVLFVGRDFGRKGGPELLEAFAAVRRRVPDAVLHVVGPVDPPVPRGLGHGVVLHGQVDKSTGALARLMERCSLFVLPSRYEPFGIAPLEAMAWGLPAVVTGEWALKECVEPGVTGAWVRPRDPDGLAEVLVGLLSDPVGLAAMGRAARTGVEQRFTWGTVVDRMAARIGLEVPGDG